MSLTITIDHDGAVPPFQQICDAVLTATRTGDLAPGARLPTVRALAADLGVAVNTVAKAYRQLEAEGVVETLGRRGTVVREHVGGADGVTAAAAVFVDTARRAGLDLDEVIGLVRRTW